MPQQDLLPPVEDLTPYQLAARDDAARAVGRFMLAMGAPKNALVSYFLLSKLTPEGGLDVESNLMQQED